MNSSGRSGRGRMRLRSGELPGFINQVFGLAGGQVLSALEISVNAGRAPRGGAPFSHPRRHPDRFLPLPGPSGEHLQKPIAEFGKT